MKKSFLAVSLVSMIATSQAFAYSAYVGYEKKLGGDPCSVSYNNDTKYILLNGTKIGGIGMYARTEKKLEGNVVELQGSADAYDVKVLLTLNAKKVPVKAVLKTRSFLVPVYVTKLVCTNLVAF